ncbi:zinc finger protein 431 [Aedes albopictus]|uniref:C2h2-type zn-finger protein n=1 Tax=Aedes albopictus TaxID=7160 RepID=A0ABM1YQ09_AEDAL
MTTAAEQSGLDMVCRVCLDNRTEMFSIFSAIGKGGPVIASVITESTAVLVEEDDGLPEWICTDCAEEVKFVASFQDKTRQSDRMLREVYKAEVKEEEEQLYALEISLLDQPKELVSKIEVADDEVFEEDDRESDVRLDVDYGDDSDVKNSDSDEDYTPEELITRKREAELSFVDANDVPSSDSDQEAKPKRKRQRSTKITKDNESVPDELDEVEEDIFMIVDVGSKFLCCTCLKLFDGESELIAHGKAVHKAKRSCNPSKPHVCNLCFRRYSSKVALQAHCKKAASITRVFDCRLCRARIASPQKRQQHAHKHPPVTSQSSAIVATLPHDALDAGKICCAQGCNQVFDTEEELLAHSEVEHEANRVQAMLNADTRRPVECRICYRRFIDEKGLKQHQQRLYMPKRHVCTVCGMKFAVASECKRHEAEHVGQEKKYECDQCDKAFYHRDQLKAHVKRHSATREFMCNICGQSYMQRHNLQAHMLKHEGKLPFECDICKKAFRVKAKLIYHKRVHSGERPFACRYCEQAFADSTNRLRHEMSHTGVKPYKCDYCEKTFITKRLKRDHEKTHSKNLRPQNSYPFDSSKIIIM